MDKDTQLPKERAGKKKYDRPALQIYGNLTQLTTSAGSDNMKTGDGAPMGPNNYTM